MGRRPAAAAAGVTATRTPWGPSPTLRLALLLLICAHPAHCLENGLARTPPMGWLAWERFQCNIDCTREPENCISERLFKEMANALVYEGYRDVGYVYVNIDDCWMTQERDVTGRLQANRTRFPNGIKHLADFMHARGLKLGIYGNVGTKTCAGYAGSLGNLYTDAQTFAEWDVDMVKMDGCYASIRDYERLYTDFGDAINRTGRPMVYSCSWPAYEVSYGVSPNYKLIGHHCNLWRNYVDIADTWQSVESVIDYYAANQNVLTAAAAPGRWNDPDMLVIGNFGLSYDQSKAQMALWAIMAAPLLMSNDLRRMRPEFKEILQNRAIIAVNQDPLGIMGMKIRTEDGVETWIRPVTPVVGESGYSFALVFFNRNIMGTTREHVTQIRTLGLLHPLGYRVTDLFENRFLDVYFPDDYLAVRVNPAGGAAMVKAEAIVPVPPVPRLPPVQLPRFTQQRGLSVAGTPMTGRSAQLPLPPTLPPQRIRNSIGVPFDYVVGVDGSRRRIRVHAVRSTQSPRSLRTLPLPT
ncbi:alpha-N-acetylgalactosaminidase-like [Dermacentor andersoni]|uniref:alpha-N-acetylgalactosaminidase-like n=1 Tax=Dermacentor andersoni TaxID=34620 RepID=UPI0021554EB9|nr:alpha-N-acetylgalactosaminidase-like [Dermacentor andersoni]